MLLCGVGRIYGCCVRKHGLVVRNYAAFLRGCDLARVRRKLRIVWIFHRRFQIGKECCHVLIAVRLPHGKALYYNVAYGYGAGRIGSGGGRQPVAIHALHGIVRCCANYALIKRCCKRVYVRPRALAALAAVLLLRRVARL